MAVPSSGDTPNQPMSILVGPVRAVIVDQMLARAALRALLANEPDVEIVAEADGAADAFEAIERLRPDIVVVDIAVPQVDGLNLIEKMAAREEINTQILVLTTAISDDAVIEVLGLGANGLMLKDARPRELMIAIDEIAHGRAWITPQVNRMLLDRLRTSFLARPTSTDSGALRDFTAREIEVLLLVVRGHSNAEIASMLNVAETTVKTHVGRILMKLGLRDRVQTVVWAYESGFVVPGAR